MPERKQRPLSPHLQVYKPQLTSVLSIAHRGTGIVLSLGALLLALYFLALASGPQTFAMVRGWLNGGIGQFGLLLWLAALYYHLCNGIRHLFWDAGIGFEMRQVYASGITVVALTVLLTLLTWLLAGFSAGNVA